VTSGRRIAERVPTLAEAPPECLAAFVEASPGAKRIEVGRVIGETFSIYGRHFVVLFGSAILVFLIAAIASALLAGPARSDFDWGELLLVAAALVVWMIARALYTGFVVRLVQDVRDGKRDFTIGELFSSAAHAIPALIVMAIVSGFAIGIGLILLIIPGLILLTIWAVAPPAIVVERAGALESLGRSRELVRGEGWSVFGVIVVVWLISAVITGVLGAIGDAISGVGYGVGVSLASFATAPLFALASSVMFFDLGGGREAPTAPAAPEAPIAPAA
jgi:Uncharacterised protein family (UPF0259)